MLHQYLDSDTRTIPLCNDFGKCGGFCFRRFIDQQPAHGFLNFAGRIARFPHANRESQSLQARQVCNLFHLHASAHHRLAGECGSHHRADSTVNHRRIGTSIHFQRSNPFGDENMGRTV